MNVGNIGSSGAQEAMETLAQTRAEAGQGDQQAVQKMARQTVAIRAPQTAPPAAAAPAAVTTTSGGRDVLDVKA